MLRLPEHVEIVEVGPRDGLQSFKAPVDTDTKVKLIDRLSATGLPVIEATAFAHPKAIPNLTDAEAVFERIWRRPGTVYRGLVPNARGAMRAAASRVDEMVSVIIISEAYLAKNQNMTLEVAIDQAIESFRIADRHAIEFVQALGMAFWCPYEGVISQDKVLQTIGRLRDGGIKRFYLAGSTGMEDARHVSALFSKAYDAFPDISLGYHVHNLGGMGTANILAALDAGAQWVEGAICGLGGGVAMPSTLGAVGNFPTEDLVRYLGLLGVETGVDQEEVLAAALEINQMLGITPRSQAANGVTREQIMGRPSKNY